jgi:hypothetical protein
MIMAMRIFTPRGITLMIPRRRSMLKQDRIRRHSKKMENLTRNDTIYFCIDDPSPPYKGVRGKGDVKVSYDVNHNVMVAQNIHMRYLGNLEHPMGLELIDAIKKGQSVILEISPKYYSTWDYSKQ